MVLSRRQWAVIYDGSCGLCSTSVKWIERLDWRHRFAPIPNQAGGLAASLRMRRETLEHSAWVVTPRGRVYGGPHAVAAVFDGLLPVAVPLFRTLARLPLISWVMQKGYDWVNQHRHEIPIGKPHLRPEAPPPALPISTLRELENR